jgi:MFS transporter, ACDE family, multidrug resistance protein
LKSTVETDGSMAPGERPGNKGNIWRQPKAVWAVAFACVIAFMGLGLVDPILPAIAKLLHATPSQVELLFSSYFLLTGVSMIVTSVVSSRLGHKRTLLVGLRLIVVFSALAGSFSGIAEIVGFRAVRGLGNALFIATGLAVIVEVSNAGTKKAVILYEAALGLGISVGPLLKSSITDPLLALRHRGLLTLGIIALCYNFGFFTMLAYTPFLLRLDAHGLGLVFFGWGVLLAVTSVFLAPRIQESFGTLPTMYAMLLLIALDLLAMGLGAPRGLCL